MCGRYARRGDKQKIAAAFHAAGTLDGVDFGETFDAAPGSIQPIVAMLDGERSLSLMRWGFKLPDRLLFNVRSEGAASASFWKEKFASNRCVVPASSYFEWEEQAPKPKPKFEIEVPGREYFAIGGVWSPWKNPKTGEWENTFSTFTSEPNALIRTVHSRQPVIVEPRDFEEWFAPSEGAPVHLLRMMPEAAMKLTLVAPHESAGTSQALLRGLFDVSIPRSWNRWTRWRCVK